MGFINVLKKGGQKDLWVSRPLSLTHLPLLTFSESIFGVVILFLLKSNSI